MAPVIALSVTAASVVATCVTRFGNTALAQPLACLAPPACPQPQGGASSQVSVTCSLYPSQNFPRFPPQRASGSYGEAIRCLPGGMPSPSGAFSRRLITSVPSSPVTRV
jgi:hypothetical protein